MEINNLQQVGEGLITDPETGLQEKIKTVAEMDLCQLVISLETQVIEDNVYPLIKLKDVAFTMNNK